MKETWKVGEVAELTGLTVRTLRYYDQIGLFSPSRHTESGHRQYTKADLARLQPIISMRQMGVPLEEIQSYTEQGSRHSIAEILEVQIERLRSEIAVQQQLLEELETALFTARARGEMPFQDILNILEALRLNQELYFSKQNLDRMKESVQRIDVAEAERLEKEFKGLIDRLHAEYEKGTSAENAEVRSLAGRWKEIIGTFSGGEPELWSQAEQFHAGNPGNELQYGVHEELYRYIADALEP
ncbi:MerR family transcriptional regulator [Bhargavaea ullalensis]|uniref:DNA-binding transcriptional MerR regulator n=1 Tax=Bhargavaea ullalensis TaxID=1265685 RepID=A0ABV2G7Z3_9BACL